MPATFSQGSIVWVAVPDSHGGNVKARPAVVISGDDEIAADGHIRVAAITTLLGRAPFSETVELPHEVDGHSVTRLKQPSEVVCSWVIRVAIDAVRDTGGRIPKQELNEILVKVERLA